VRFELCRVRRERHPLSFCTLPLYGLGKLKQAIPHILDGWLAYHLAHMGFSHAEIYDTDGSFEGDIQSWKNLGYSIGYQGSWPSWLSQELGTISAGHTGCAESLAYAHCLTQHRALSRWVMLLHGPDEYVRLASRPGQPHPRALAEVVQRLSASVGHQAGVLTVRSWPFAHGTAAQDDAEEAAAARRPWGAGEVLASSQMRAPRLDISMHTPLLDPERCTCAGPHNCVSEKGYRHGNVSEVGENILVTHHYLEMLPWDRGRCGRLHKGLYPCRVPDDSLLWAAKLLRDGIIG